MDIINLLKQSESKTLEFKQDLSSPMGVVRTIVAFANTAGGTIVLGVEDKEKRVCGIKEPLLLEEKLANLINDLMDSAKMNQNTFSFDNDFFNLT